MIGEIFNSFFYQPLLNFLIFLYDIIPGGNLGVAIIFLTVFIKFLLLPLELKAFKSQMKFAKIQEELKEVQERFKQDKEKILKETFQIYKKHNANPFSSLFLFLIQIPILFALWKLFSQGEFLQSNINPFFIGINLTAPNIYLVGISAILQFFQISIFFPKPKLAAKKDKFLQIFQKQMNYFIPFFTFLILIKIPSAVALYLSVSLMFSVIEQLLILKKQ